jgi:hypothetical protein
MREGKPLTDCPEDILASGFFLSRLGCEEQSKDARKSEEQNVFMFFAAFVPLREKGSPLESE